MKTVAIVLAAGQGKRMNSDVAKQYLMIHEKPVLYYSLSAFENSFIDEIILVVGKGEEEYCRQEVVKKYTFQKISHIVAGGKERYHSVFEGIKCVEDADYIFIHDGARPFVTEEILVRGLECVKEWQACVVGMPSKDTIKIADENELIVSTPQRNLSWIIQTPQIFEYELIKEAYEKLIDEEKNILDNGISITDDAMVVELLTNQKIKLVEGSYENIKITTPGDLKIATVLVKK